MSAGSKRLQPPHRGDEQGIAADERAYSQRLFEEYRQTLLDERQEQRERQILEDREAARLATFRLEQILQNQEISAQEREFAISQLNEAKAIAAGERDEDKRRFLEERDRKEIERDFMVQEYQQSKAQRAEERAFACSSRQHHQPDHGNARRSFSRTVCYGPCSRDRADYASRL